MMVSVPYGDLFYFYLAKALRLTPEELSFRPLWGSFLFLYNEKNSHSTNSFTVSVPYGDLFYFYAVSVLSGILVALMFPSPMGIFFISMKLLNI